MAIKPVTNTNVTNESTINRAEQTSIRSEKGNAKVVIKKPGGRNAGEGWTIGLKEIDTAILGHIKNIMKPVVRESNEIIKVPVLWGSEERWKSIRGRGVLTDKNGTIILPVMVVKRTSVSMNPEMPVSFDNDVQGKFIKVVRANRYSKNNRYDRFSVLTGQKPVQESIITGQPDFVTCNYNVVMMTSYTEQMNDLNAIWIEHLETYFGDSTSHRFLTSLAGDISNEVEMESQGERLIKNTLDMTIKAYMIPEFTDKVFGKTSEVKRVYSNKKISFSEKII